MAYLGVLEAVRARLEGKPFKYVPPLNDDVAKAWGEKFTALEAQNLGHAEQAAVQMQLKSDVYTLVGNVSVPIFFFDAIGAEHSTIYPSLTYEVTDFSPRYDNYMETDVAYGGNVYCEPLEGSAENVADEDGTSLGVSARIARVRAVEHPFDITVEIRAYAQMPFESAMLVKHVYERFPPRHFLRVPMRDGTHRSWDMLHENYTDLDKRIAARSGSPGIQREYAKVWTYRVEGYLDNTDTARLVHFNRRRVVTAAAIDDA